MVLKKKNMTEVEGPKKKWQKVGSGFFGRVHKIRVHDMCSLMELSLICYEFADQHVIMGQLLHALS